VEAAASGQPEAGRPIVIIEPDELARVVVDDLQNFPLRPSPLPGGLKRWFGQYVGTHDQPGFDRLSTFAGRFARDVFQRRDDWLSRRQQLKQ
jgi:hypothetical protein